MGSIGAGDLVLLRDRKDTHKTIERLYGFGLPPMWKGRVNDASIARGDQTIAYDNGAMETGFVFADLELGLMLFIGSAEGLDDKGRRRILSISGTAASGTIIVDWYDDIEADDNDYLTIVHFYSIWPRYSWFDEGTSDFRKDGKPSGEGGAGLDYTGNNATPPPHILMGRHYAGELPAGGSLPIQMDASNSKPVTPGATISTYAWSISPSGGASISSTSASAPTLTLTTEGRWWVRCQITDSNGRNTIGWRAVMVGNCATEFTRGPLTETFDQHNVRCSISLTSPDASNTDAIRPTVNYDDFPDGTLVVITAEDHYGATQKSITFRDATVYTDREHIVYAGYLIRENRSIDQGSGAITFEATTTPPVFMYSMSLTGVRSPSDWYEMSYQLMYVGALLHHLLYWHSTFIFLQDWWLPWSDTTKRSVVDEWTEGDIIERGRSLVGPHGRLMTITGNSQGEVFIETDANLRSEADRNSVTVTMTLADGDIQGAKQARVRHRPDVSQVFVSGGVSEGFLGSFAPYLSISQNVRKVGDARDISFERLMLPSQTEANRLSGRILAVLNRRLDELPPLTFSGLYREVFSPADQQWTNAGAIFDDALLGNLRGVTDLENVRLMPRAVTKNPAQGGFGKTVVSFEIEAPAGELPGRTVTLPTLDPDYIPEDEGEPPFLEPPVPAGVLATGDDTNGVEIYETSEASWSSRNAGLSGDALKVNALRVSPFWYYLQNSSDYEDTILYIATDNSLQKSVDFGKSWSDVTPVADATTGYDPADVDFVSVDVFGSPTDIDRVICAAAYDSGNGHSYLFLSTDRAQSWLISKRTSIRTLSLRIDQTIGTQLYEAYLESSNLYVRQLDTSLALVGSAEDFGAATEAEIDARTYKLAMVTTNDPSAASNEDYVIAFGLTQKA